MNIWANDKKNSNDVFQSSGCAASRSPRARGSRNVLIVQADPAMRASLFDQLQERFNLLFVDSAREAQKIVLSLSRIDALIAQASFSRPSRGSTFLLVKTLRKRHPRAVFFVTTAAVMTNDHRKDFEQKCQLTISGSPAEASQVGQEIVEAIGLR